MHVRHSGRVVVPTLRRRRDSLEKSDVSSGGRAIEGPERRGRAGAGKRGRGRRGGCTSIGRGRRRLAHRLLTVCDFAGRKKRGVVPIPCCAWASAERTWLLRSINQVDACRLLSSFHRRIALAVVMIATGVLISIALKPSLYSSIQKQIRSVPAIRKLAAPALKKQAVLGEDANRCSRRSAFTVC